MLGVLTSTTKEAREMEGYAGQQFVGIDLHRRRTVIVRMTQAGKHVDRASRDQGLKKDHGRC